MTTSMAQCGSEYTLCGVSYTVTRICDVCGEPKELEKGGYEFYRRCKCARSRSARNMSERLRKRGLSDITLHSMRFDNDREYNQSVCKKAREYAAHWDEMKAENIGLLLSGGVGTGKTFYAGCIANALIDRGVYVLMTTLSKVIGAGFGDEYREALKNVEEADLVIFDDVGAERGTEFAWERAFDTIDTRIRSGKPMIVTTNLSPKTMSLCENIRERRVYDRILGSCVVIPVTGQSIRLKQHNDKADKLRKMLEG